MQKALLKNWTVSIGSKTIPAAVPGDVTIDCFKAGLVSNPYFAENYKESEWVQRENPLYKTSFEVTKDLLNEESVELVFNGIDLFSKIYLNEVLLGETKNMFLQYRFDVKNLLKLGINIVEVHMESTLNSMDKYETKGYSAAFNVARIFVRKAQCHFGWDWAPKICGFGIWQDVYLEAKNKHQIKDFRIVTDIEGNVTFFTEINYNVRVLLLPDGQPFKEAEPNLDDELVFSVSTKPFGEEYVTSRMKIKDQKSFHSLKLNNPELWWPNGYGEQPLYNYRIELYRNHKLVDSKIGRFTFREVKLLEKPIKNDMLGFRFLINNEPIFIKGSNWVPIECFTGVVEDEKYRKILKLAKDGNINCLRVWGGGIYEKDIFYDTCDEYGLLVWQDIMMACADTPANDKDFINNLCDEVAYQVRRLRNHPCLFYFVGGNEKTGSYGLMIVQDDFLFDVTIPGIINTLDGTRPYRRQSPYSYSDVGNDVSSGECHHNVFELALVNGMSTYRERLNDDVASFVSECAIMGPSSLETLKKIFPEDHLWPMDEMWRDRFMENPYGSVPLDFPHRELKYATVLYKNVENLEDFVTKGMMAHAESLRAEVEYCRAHKGLNWGILNWMYSDIWPSGTWAVVDYFLEPKQAYYQMRRSFKEVYASFYEDEDGDTRVFVVNDSLTPIKLDLKVYEKTYDSKTVAEQTIKDVVVDNSKSQSFKLNHKVDKNHYVVVEYLSHKTLYSPDMYSSLNVCGEFEYRVKQINKSKIEVEIKAISFVKSLFMHFKDNYKYRYSDNYLDMEKEDVVTVTIESDEDIDPKELQISCYSPKK